MLFRYSCTWTARKFLKSPSVLVRKCHNTSAAVALSYTDYEHHEPEAEPFIIMHGLFGSKTNWNSLCKSFAQKTEPPRKIISIDARNHGMSPHTEKHTYPLMAEDILRFMRDHKIKKTSLMGHSMGGRAVMYFALKYPQLVDKLIVVDISPVSPIGTNRTDIALFIEAMQAVKIPKDYTIHQGRNVAHERLSKIISERSLRDFLITNLVKTEHGEFSWRINLATIERDFREGVANFPDCSRWSYTGPTLFIGGNKSDFLKPEDKPKIDKLFPNSELVYLDAGHWVHAEQPGEFLSLVLKFMNH